MRLIVVFLVSVFACSLVGQVTFNKRLHFGFPACVMTGVTVTDSCFYFTGIVADSVPPHKVGCIFARFGLDGSHHFHKVLASTERTYATWQPGLTAPGGDILLAGHTTDSVRNVILLRFDSNGDTLSTRQFPHPLFPEHQFITPRGPMGLATDGGQVIANTIDGPDGLGDLYLIRTGSAGEMAWDSILFNPGITDLATGIFPAGQGEFLLGGWTSDYNTALENFTSKARIVRLSGDGEILWEYLTPASAGLRDGANDMVLLGDGSIVVASGKGTEIERPTGNTI